MSGYLEVIAGSMFSGKTEELIRRARRALIAKRRVLIVKPHVDDRYGTEAVFSHDGQRIEATAIDPADPQRIALLAQKADAHVVAVDEAQFFGRGLLPVVEAMVGEGRRVILAGLDMDFARRPFPPMPELMAMADEVTKLKAICVRCGEPATYTQRIVGGQPAAADDPVILIGGREAYEARCRRCHELAPKRAGYPPMEELLAAARAAAASAYAPYSSFRVGAAVLSADGRLFSGCNVENASYGLSVCAERVAAFSAAAAGALPIQAVAVASPNARPCLPCGACRQVLAELGGDGLRVVVEGQDGAPEIIPLGDLLPRAFRLGS